MAALALGVSPNTLRAADNIIIGPSGTETGTSGSDFSWTQLWGPAFVSVTFDTANPPPTGDTAGSIYMQNNWSGSDADTYLVAAPANWFGGVAFNAADYATIEMDIKYDTNSTITPIGSANMGIGFDAWYSFQSVTNISFSGADGKWHHLSIRIDPSMAGVSTVYSVGFYVWNPASTIGTMNYWVANVELIARVVPNPPPTTSLSKAMPGLQQFADATPSWDRDGVRTFTNGAPLVSWVGRPKPVVYSFTMTAFPTNAGFNVDLCLTPGDPATQTYADPDWSMPNALLLAIQANGNGSENVSFGYKTNQPIGNSMLSGAGALTNFTYSGSALGTWSLTFTSDTDATITAPDGSTYSGSIPAANAALFADPACFDLFSAPGVDASVGQSVTFASLSLTGVGTPINQDFTTGSLNPLLVLQSQEYNSPWNTNPPNQFLLPTSNGTYWNHWTLPDTGFSPIVTSNLTAGVWQDEAYSSILVNGGQRWALVLPTSLPSASVGFFALVQRTFTQLQVLLPGQTNAPGTASGYVGTPLPQSLSAGIPQTVTVYAVDPAFHIVSGVSDSIALTASDGSAFLPMAMNMTNGIATFADANGILWGSQGVFTVTASDTTSTTVTNSATSAPVTVGP